MIQERTPLRPSVEYCIVNTASRSKGHSSFILLLEEAIIDFQNLTFKLSEFKLNFNYLKF